MGKWFLVALLGLLSVVLIGARVYPLGANFSPVLALCLISGFLAQKRPSLLILPLLALILSDSIIGFYPGMAFTYLAYGVLLLGGSRLPANLAGHLGGGFLGAVLFFIVSNFGVWFATRLYTPDWSGLLTCYEMAIPFFRSTLLSTLGSITIFYGIFSVVSKNLQKEILVKA